MFKTVLLSLIILPCSLFAQRSTFVGDYVLGRGTGDTMTARLFISKDTFKLVYQVRHDSDFIFPVYIGSWDTDPKKNIITLKAFSGRTYSWPYKIVTYGEKYLMQFDLGSENIFTKNSGPGMYRKE